MDKSVSWSARRWPLMRLGRWCPRLRSDQPLNRPGRRGNLGNESSSDLLCGSPPWSVRASAGMSTLWRYPSSIFSTDHSVARPPRCPEGWFLEKLSCRRTCCLTHSFILRREETPVCVACGAVITVKRILIEYVHLLEIRKKYFEERSLFSLFRNVTPEIIFDSFARDWCALQNIKCVTEMFEWSVFKELFKNVLWNVLQFI